MTNLKLVTDLADGDVFLGPNGLWCTYTMATWDLSDGDAALWRVHYRTPAGARHAWSYHPDARVTLRSHEAELDQTGNE